LKESQVSILHRSLTKRKEGNEMPKITVDDVDYNTEDLTDNGKAQLASLQFLEVQMRKLQNEISVYQTARNAYVAALKAELVKAS
jgi:hypothetical protein